MLRFLRLRYLALALLIWYGTTSFDAQKILRLPIEHRFKSFFSAMGYPDATFDTVKITLSHLVLENIVLDYDETGKDAISVIERIEAEYSPWDLITGNIKRVVATHPDLFFSADAMPRFPAVTLSRQSSLSDLPIGELEINDLNISYAGEDFNPSLSGKIIMNTEDDQSKRILVTLNGEQKDLSVDLKIAANETVDGHLSVDLDIPEIRMDIPDVAKISRGSGKLRLVTRPGLPLRADGKFVAGAMRIGKLPLDNITLSVNGQKPKFNLIGSASITGMPQTNISLRATEDAKDAQVLAQLSGEAPAALARLLKLDLILPEQQKFSIAAELKNRDLASLVRYPYRGGIFLYQDKTDPFIKAKFACVSSREGCTIDIPTSPVTFNAFNTWVAPTLADQGLTINKGDILFGGKITTWKENKPTQFNLEGALKNSSLDWRGLAMTDFNAYFTGTPETPLIITRLQTRALGGTLRSDRIESGNKTKASGGTIILDRINLTDLAQLMRSRGLDMTGTASGSIPFTVQNGKTIISDSASITAKNGTVNYSPKSWPAFLIGSDERMKTLRDTLKGYKFDEMKVDMNGPIGKNVQANMFAKGYNQALYGDRPIHMNLKLDGPLAPGLVRLVPD